MTPERIKRMRLRLGMTQTDLAREMGLENRSTICRWENGDRVPRGANLVVLLILERGENKSRKKQKTC